MKIFDQLKTKMPTDLLFKLMRFWPPYLGAGIKVRNIDNKFLSLDTEMNLTWYNQNFVGTHFGGSLYAMTDPFYMLILIKQLGSSYIVWDKASKIEYLKPGKGKVKAHFEFTQEEIDEIILKSKEKKKHIFNKEVFIFDEVGDIVAKVEKTLYVKKNSAV